jgi:hypothetical protein
LMQHLAEIFVFVSENQIPIITSDVKIV